MRKHLLLCTLLFSFGFITNCKEDNSIHRIRIHNPTSADKNLNEILQIEVEFETLTGPVEHINVKIWNSDKTILVYDEPFDPHIPGDESIQIFEDQFALSTSNGLTSGDWILEARVNTSEDGSDEVFERVEFHIN